MRRSLGDAAANARSADGAHNLSGNTGAGYTRRAKSIERRAAAQTTAGARH